MTQNMQNLSDQDKKLVELRLKVEDLLKEYNAVLVPTTIIQNNRVFNRIDVAYAEQNSEEKDTTTKA
jgi:hypothetical protein